MPRLRRNRRPSDGGLTSVRIHSQSIVDHNCYGVARRSAHAQVC